MFRGLFMRKIPVFYVLIGLLLAVSANAANLTGVSESEDLSFCFKSGTETEFYQGATGAAGEECYSYWYDESSQSGNDPTNGVYVDAYNYLEHISGSIKITSDIKFAGRTGESCNTGANAFKGKGLGFGEGFGFEPDGNNVHTISGLCYVNISGVASTKASFAYVPGDINISNLIFDDVYFKASGSASIFGEASRPIDFSNITIKNSVFSAEKSGSLIAEATGTITLSNVKASNVTVSGSGYVGGFVGNDEISSIDNTSFEGTVTGTGSGAIVGGFVGRMGYSWRITIDKSYVKGNVTGGLVTGGFIGLLMTPNSSISGITIENSYSIGDILPNDETGAVSGYMIGRVQNQGADPSFGIVSNYHYGENDAATKLVVGSYVDDSGDPISIDLEGGSSNKNQSGTINTNGIYRNVRNAASGTATGTLYIGSQDIVKESGSSDNLKNGIVDDADMATAKFAWILDYKDESGRSGLWTQNPSVNEGLPFFMDSENSPIKAVFFRKLDATNKTKLGYPSLLEFEYYDAYDSVMLFTNSSKKLDSLEVKALNDAIGETHAWKNIDDGSYLEDLYAPNEVTYENYELAIYNFVFDVNTTDTVFYSNGWESTKIGAKENDHYSNAYLPDGIKRLDACLEGWNLSPSGSSLTFKNYANVDFPSALASVTPEEIDGKDYYRLYAVWDETCGSLPESYDLTTDILESQGEFVISQTFDGKTIARELTDANTVRQIKDWAYDFTVEFVPKAPYRLTDSSKIIVTYCDDEDNSKCKEEFESGGVFVFYDSSYTGATDAVLTVTNLKSDSFYVAYNFNTSEDDYENLYFPSNAKLSDSLSFENETYVSLWKPYRTDMCFAGWSTNPKADASVTGSNVFSEILASKVRNLQISTDAEKPTKLYAIWETCSKTPTTDIVISNANPDVDVVLKQTFGDLEIEHRLGSEPVKLPLVSSNALMMTPIGYLFRITTTVGNIKGSAKVEYNYGADADSWEEWSPYTIENDFLLGVGSYNTYRVSAKSDIYFALDYNTETPVFVGNDWVSAIYNADVFTDETSLATLPQVLARKDACFMGWSPRSDSKVGYANYAETDFVELLKDVTPEEQVYKLYAVWKDCEQETFTITSDVPAEQGSFYIYQPNGNGTKIAVGNDGLEIPVLSDMEIVAYFEPSSRYAYVDSIDVKIGDDEQRMEDYSMFRIEQGQKNILLFAKPEMTATDYTFAFDLNADDSTVFYGYDWNETRTYKLSGEYWERAFPAEVYRSDKCIAGWSLKPDKGEIYTALESDLVSQLSSDKATLYARWTDSLSDCAASFMRLEVNHEQGSIAFVKGDTIHRFMEDGTMMLPMGFFGADFTLKAFPKPGFVFDSLVISFDQLIESFLNHHAQFNDPNNSMTEEERRDHEKWLEEELARFAPRVLLEGDTLPDMLDGVTLRAYFSGTTDWTPLELVDTTLLVSGKAIQLSFRTNDFAKSRRVSAKLHVFDIETGSIAVDSLIADSIVAGTDMNVVLRLKHSGDYKLVLILGDEYESVDYHTEFTVMPAIVSVEKESWKMVSLAAMDKSTVDWKSDDQLFYWWDERGTGEFWQYKRYGKTDRVEGMLGGWYSSLEGRSLEMRSDDDEEAVDFEWNLDSVSTGWNMVANPYGWPVSLYAKNEEAQKGEEDQADIYFLRYDAETGAYLPTSSVGPYEAVWAKVGKKMKWSVSAEPVFPVEVGSLQVHPELEPELESRPEKDSLLHRTLAKTSTKEHWTLQAVLSDKNGKRDSWNIFGAGLNPFTAEEPPESMGDHVNLSIVEGKKFLAKSIRNFSDEMEWDISLSASDDRVGYLTLEGVDGVKAYGYHVYVTVDGNTTEMQEGVPLQVYLKSTAKTATVRVAPTARVVVQNTLKGLRSARLGNKLQVSFEASNGLAGKNARVDLMDMKGNVVSSVSAKTAEGSNALLLDAPQTGLYMLRVRAGSARQVVKIMVK